MKCEKKKSEKRETISIAQKAVHSAATIRKDEKILRLCHNYDFIASEARYHKTCYRLYTKIGVIAQSDESSDVQHSLLQDEEETLANEETLFQLWFQYIRSNIVEESKVVSVVELSSIFESLLTEHEVDSIAFHSHSFKQKLRRRLEKEFSKVADIFQNAKGKLIFLPNAITRQQLACDLLRAQHLLEKEGIDSTKAQKQIREVALNVRSDVKALEGITSWPPGVSELNPEQVTLPSSLQLLLSYLIHGNTKKSTKTNSLGQDIIYNVHQGGILTPKHLLLPFTVKSMTGSIELIKILNRLGHGVSYSKIYEVDTAYAIQKFSSSTSMIPDEIQPYQQVTLVYDNIDRREETLSGAGTTHRVNGIAIQKAFIGPQLPPSHPNVPKTKQRSIKVDHLTLPVYNVGSRPDPPVLPDTNVSIVSSSAMTAKKKNLIWIICRYLHAQNQYVPSWTGFNIQVRKNISVLQDSVGYLPTIDSPATAMNTVYEILCKALETKSALELDSVIVVFDQAIYSKAVEIMWKHGEEFKSVVPRLGAFHTIVVLLSIIGKRFGDAGLRDTIIESGVIEEGSVAKVLDGKHYNRAVRFHKLMYEACMRILWEGFREWTVNEHDGANAALDSFAENANDILQDEVDQQLHNEFLESPLVDDLHLHFQQYLDILRNRNGSMSAFWMTYIDLVELLLNLLRASREGDWNLHLDSLNKMIPWCFAYNKSNYAKYLPWYLLQMLNLPNTHPDLHKYLIDGGFSTQIGENNPFGCIPMDQTIEETINKDTQTAGGTKGFSTKKGAVAKYYVSADYRASCVRHLRQMVQTSSNGSKHPDLSISRIKRDEADVHSILEMLTTIWINPFVKPGQDLCSLSTGASPPDEVVNDLLNAEEIGREAWEIFRAERLSEKRSMKFFDVLPRLKLKSFPALKQVNVSTNEKQVALRADKNLFSMMALISQSRRLDMPSVLAHPLGPVPWALASADGTLRKTNKAALGIALEKLADTAEVIPTNSACIIDGMSIVRKTNGNQRTFGEICNTIHNTVLLESGQSDRIDLVFDVYQEKSIKNAERVKRGAAHRTQYKTILPSHKIKQWQSFLKDSNNKCSFIRFLCKEWRNDKYCSKLKQVTLFVAYDRECWKLTADGAVQVDSLACSHEEADTRMLFHAKKAAENRKDAVVIVCEDTDVLVLATAMAEEIGVPIYQRRGNQSRTRYINVSSLRNALGDRVAKCLPGMHSFTGCDTVSAFAGKGKLAAYKLVTKSSSYSETFTLLGSQAEVLLSIYFSLFGKVT